MPSYVAITVGRSGIWTICDSLDQARDAINGIKHMNRWWRENESKVGATHFPADESVKPNDPLTRPWRVEYHAGHAGWDCIPLCDRWGEEGIEESVEANTPSHQQCYVKAPNALLAIERAKFMLMERGKTK